MRRRYYVLADTYEKAISASFYLGTRREDIVFVNSKEKLAGLRGGTLYVVEPYRPSNSDRNKEIIEYAETRYFLVIYINP